MKELIKLVCQWSIEKGIKDNSSIETQLLYTQSELSELYLAMSKNDLPEIKDAIGDVIVTLINAFYIATDSVEKTEELILEYLKAKNHKPQSHSLKDYFYILQEELMILMEMNEEPDEIEPIYIHSIYYLMIALNELAVQYHLSLIDCLSSAYDVISKRTGKNINGVFVKDK